jgi:hypothetical protein
MRRLIVLTPAFVLVAACGGSSVKQESASERTADKSSRIGSDAASSQPKEP